MPGRHLSILRDITERKDMESAIRENEQQFRHIFDKAGAGVAQTDLAGRFLLVNERYCEITGRSASQLQEMRIDEITDPADLESYRTSLDELIRAGKPFTAETRNVRPDGSVVWVRSDVSAILDLNGAPRRLVAVCHDINERKSAQDDLERANRRITNILESISDAFTAYDREWRFVYINSRSAEMLGVSREDVLGKKLSEVKTGGIPAGYLENLNRAVSTGAPIHFEIYSEPAERWYENQVFPASDGVAVYTRDITDRKRAEEELALSAAELARSNADLQQFAYVTSHDLREPLRMIVAFSQLLERRYKQQLDANADDFIQFIVSGATRMDALIDDLLSYSSVANVEKLRSSHVELLDAVRWSLRNLAVTIGESDADVVVNPLPAVEGNLIQLVQLFQNLVSNGIKYRGQAKPRIEISAEAEDAEWIVSVADNGIGIAPEYRERVFGLFKRLHGKTIPGTGIGLAICKKIVEKHNGRIWVDPNPEGGATFRFRLPAASRNGGPAGLLAEREKDDPGEDETQTGELGTSKGLTEEQPGPQQRPDVTQRDHRV
jgi:PAS domain S-box-containing protein